MRWHLFASMVLFLASVAGGASAQDTRSYHAYFDDVDGLRVDTPVQVAGYTVGRIVAIDAEMPALGLAGIRFRVSIDLDPALNLIRDRTRLQVIQPLPMVEARLGLFETAGGPGGSDDHVLAPGGEIRVADDPRAPTVLSRVAILLTSVEDFAVASKEALPDAADAVAALERRLERLLDELEGELLGGAESLRVAAERWAAFVGDTAGTDPESAYGILRAAAGLIAALDRTVADVARRIDETSSVLSSGARRFVDKGVAGMEAFEEGMDAIDLPALVETLAEVERTIAGTGRLLDELRARVADLQPVTAPPNIALIERSLQSLDRVIATLAVEVPPALRSINESAASLNRLTRTLERDPSSVLWGTRGGE
ncbi:MAG: MCE family protein [Geminicoccaceae bacterium]|nr:MCE family protein [Geminicoccaceae bacterium]